MDLIVDFPQHPTDHSTSASPGVSFQDHCDVYLVDNFSMYKDDLWYSKSEITSTKQDSTRFLICLRDVIGVTLAEYALMHPQDTSAFLGLEKYFTLKTSQQILIRRRGVGAAVLKEQKRQGRLGIYDMDRFAEVSRAQTILCRRRARIIGLLHSDKRDTLDSSPLVSCQEYVKRLSI